MIKIYNHFSKTSGHIYVQQSLKSEKGFLCFTAYLQNALLMENQINKAFPEFTETANFVCSYNL